MYTIMVESLIEHELVTIKSSTGYGRGDTVLIIQS